MPTDAPWLQHYDPGVPPSLEPYPDRTLVDYLSDAARTQPNAAALLFKGTTLTFAELDRLSDACASAFAALGIARGDRVGLLLPNCPQFFIAEFGAWKLGAIVAPFNPTYTERELECPIREHGVETIVTLTRFYRRIKALQRRTPLKRVIATNIKQYFPPVLRALFTLLRETREGDRVAIAPGDHDFAHLLVINRGHTPPHAALTSDAPAVLLLSGGTTGTPKGVLGSHSAYVQAGLQIQRWNASVLRAGDVILAPLPLFHVYANVGIQSLAFITGNALSLVPNPRDLPDLLKTIARTKPAFFNGVPTLYIALLNHPDVQAGKIDFRSIKICFSGASALLADTKQRFEALTGA
ncbi:MAG TPA: AMP-binding protein, partial [Vicinamibacterales bacterium]|nr:AMP-binding protein [Vicinamibacterales bacterium]